MLRQADEAPSDHFAARVFDVLLDSVDGRIFLRILYHRFGHIIGQFDLASFLGGKIIQTAEGTLKNGLATLRFHKDTPTQCRHNLSFLRLTVAK